MSTSVDLQKPLTILQNSGMLLAKYYMHVYVNPDLFHLAGATTSDPCRGGDDVPKKVRVFGLKHLFLKRFTVRSTTRTLITDKNDHSAFAAITY